jgi:hypothetical protein
VIDLTGYKKSPSIADIAKSFKQEQGANFVANAVKSLQQKLANEKENAFPTASAKVPTSTTTASYSGSGQAVFGTTSRASATSC